MWIQCNDSYHKWSKKNLSQLFSVIVKFDFNEIQLNYSDSFYSVRFTSPCASNSILPQRIGTKILANQNDTTGCGKIEFCAFDWWIYHIDSCQGTKITKYSCFCTYKRFQQIANIQCTWMDEYAKPCWILQQKRIAALHTHTHRFCACTLVTITSTHTIQNTQHIYYTYT